MARKGKSTEEIIGFLREAEVRLAQGRAPAHRVRGERHRRLRCAYAALQRGFEYGRTLQQRDAIASRLEECCDCEAGNGCSENDECCEERSVELLHALNRRLGRGFVTPEAGYALPEQSAEISVDRTAPRAGRRRGIKSCSTSTS